MLAAKRFQRNFKYAMQVYAKYTGKSIGKAKLDFAKHVGKSYAAVCTYASGDAMPSLQNIEAMAANIGLHARDFLKKPEAFAEMMGNITFHPEKEENIRKILSSHLKAKLSEKNMTTAGVAEALSIKTASAHTLIHGKTLPSPDTLDTICRFFSIEPYELLTPTEETAQIAKYDALRIDGAPPVKVTASGVRFTVECTFLQADKLLELSGKTQATPNEILTRSLDEQ